MHNSLINYFTFCVFVSLLFVVSCETASQSNSDSRELPDQQNPNTPRASRGVDSLFSIGTDSTDLLYEVGDMFVQCDTLCYLYVLDAGSYKIKRYNDKGNLDLQVGSQGYGPGEFRSPVSITHSYNGVIVSEQRSFRAHLFSKDLKYKKDIVIDNIPFDMESMKNKNIIVSGLPSQKNKKLSNFLKVSAEDYNVSSISIPVPELPEQVDDVSQEHPLLTGLWQLGRLATHGDTLVVAFTYHDRVVAVRNNDQIWAHNFEEIPDSPEINSTGARPMPAQKLLTGLATDQSGNTYVLLGSGSAPNRAVHILDENGEKRRELLLPYKANSIAWSPPNRLYTEEAGGTRIGAYRITSTSK